MFLLVVGDDTLDLDDPDAGYAIQSVELGAPSTRDVSNDRPNSDGNYDQTAYVGARAVTVTVEVLPGPTSRQTLIDQVARFLHPRSRIDLLLDTERGGPVRRLRVRPDQFSAPMEAPWHVAMSLGFKTVGTPFLTGLNVNQLALAPLADEDGVAFDWTFDLVFPGSLSSTVIVTNAGDQPAHWTCRIYGPVTGPRIRNETLGLQVSFPTLTIAAGSYVDVSSENRTALADGVSSRYSFLDFVGTTWWLLEPGDNAITLPTSVHDAPAQAQISWLDTYLV